MYPVNVQEEVLSGVNDENECLKKTDEKQPVENIFFGIGFENGRFFEKIFEYRIGSYQNHQEQDNKYETHDDVDDVHKTQEVVEETDK